MQHKKILGFGIPVFILAGCIFFFSQSKAEKKSPRPEKQRTSCRKKPAPPATAPSGPEVINLSGQFS